MPLSTVTPAPLTITAEDTTRPYGQANPEFTFSYSGFQNNETEVQLVAPPQGLTTATETSQSGDYPITVAGAEDSNYRFTYEPGTLKVTPVSMAVSIPNAFTPNGDGKNDTWGIRNLSTYTNCKVTVFNRYGQAVFTSAGYGEPWNGWQNGKDVPAGTYVYVIDLGNGGKPMTGTVIVIR
jgi:gliding motility-associated-like protein